MKFKLDRNTQGFEMLFSDEEIDIISKKKRLIFDPENAKHFSNNLGAIACEINMNLEDTEYSRMQTPHNHDIKTK
jgi:hypothetical protein